MKLVFDIDDRVVDDELLAVRINDCRVDMIKLLCAYHIPLGDIIPLAKSVHYAVKDGILLQEGGILGECIPKKWYSEDMPDNAFPNSNSCIENKSDSSV